jgi:hypothetical protein
MSTQQSNPDDSQAATDLSELQSAIGDPATKQPTDEQAAAATSAALGKKYHPTQVPYLNDSYTFADREEELRFMQSMLTFRLRAVNAELEQLAEINRSRSYPNIAFQAPAAGAQE